jgi:hypothetical protein
MRKLIELSRAHGPLVQPVALALIMFAYLSLFIPPKHWRWNVESEQTTNIHRSGVNHGLDFESRSWSELKALEADRPAWMIIAAYQGDITRMKQLIDEGVDVNAQSESGVTALISAASGLQHEAAALLLSHGADPSKVTGQGFSAYDFAHNQNDEVLARMLRK